MALTIKKTGAKLSAGINVRSELHGDDHEGACDFTLKGIMLDKEDLNELYGDKYYWESVFNRKGKLTEPMTRRNKPFQFIGKFEASHVTLWLGLSDQVLKLSQCKIGKITVEPLSGGLCELTLQVQSNPTADDLSHLYTHQGIDISASIRFGKETMPKSKEQVEIPLGTSDSDPVTGEQSSATH